jgi:hypothetical protein
MNKPVGSGNPFIRASQEILAKGDISETKAAMRPASTRSPRARVNLHPDDDTLFGMIEQALKALARGHFWDRGAIVNILV